MCSGIGVRYSAMYSARYSRSVRSVGVNPVIIVYNTI